MYTQTLVVPTLRFSSPLSPLSVPSICISPAADAPVYPHTPTLEAYLPEDALSPRSSHLLPPPVLSPLRHSLAPSTKAADKKGLDQSTFEDLLNANRERAAKRSVNSADRLRREVVVKAHHSKQIERRAHFLSRITALPSPTSTETAVTPPDTPAVFNFTLPSPGLASPLELFETVTSTNSWVEQVDYNSKPVPTLAPAPSRAASRLPSLDQITARLRSARASTAAIPTVVVNAPAPVVAPLNIVVKDTRQDEVKPRSRFPESIRASTRARSASPPTPTDFPASPTTPSQLIISRSPPKSIKPINTTLVPQSIPALRINNRKLNSVPSELAPVPVMSWRDRETARSPTVPVAPKQVSMGAWKEPQTQSGLWRDAQGQLTSWRELPIKKEVVRTGVPPISPRTITQLPIGMKPAPAIPIATRPKVVPTPVAVRASVPVVDVLGTSRRSAMWRVQRDAGCAVQFTESERRAVQGRNMVDKLKRRISAPAEMEGHMRRGVPVGGF